MSSELHFWLQLGDKLDVPPPGERGVTILERLLPALKLRHREGALIPFVPTPVQSELLRSPHRNRIILKARQLGITTCVAARFFLKTITRPGTLTVQVAHDQESAEEIFKIVRRFLDHLPEELRAVGAGYLRTSRANSRQLVFPALDSEYRVETAASPNAGRGLTIQNLHCSEVARWPRFAADTLASLRAAVPATGEIVLESTPNGAHGCFYQEWRQADETGYQRFFFPWWREPAYCRPAALQSAALQSAGLQSAGLQSSGLQSPGLQSSGLQSSGLQFAGLQFEDPHPLTPDEINLAQRFGLSDGQLAFRRHIQAGYRVLAPQEFCEDAESCFLVAGDCVFDLEAIEKRLPFCAQQYSEQRENGALRTWYPPSPSRRYLIGVDPAGGGAHGDYSCAEVLDLPTGLQCAELRGHFPPQELAVRVASLARDYNNALLVIERNNHGHAVLAHLQCPAVSQTSSMSDLVIPRPFRAEESAVSPTAGSQKPASPFETRNSKLETSAPLNLYEKAGTLGWLTTAANRPQMIAALAAALATEPRLFNSAVLLEECRTFVRQPNGAASAAPGSHDDCVLAMAIALSARNEVLQEKYRQNDFAQSACAG